ncbi:MAG: DUF4410 domain-containing protein [Nitrospirae bacterium]|nr:DUF4410 domain-containing protein [Nitrospirota bacterium]
MRKSNLFPFLTYGILLTKFNSKEVLVKKQILYFVILAVIVLTGCGTTTLSLKPDSKTDFTQFKSLTIKTAAADGVVIPDSAQTRIKDRVRAEISGGCCPKRFESIHIDNIQPDDLLLIIQFTKYDEGNRFARAMLAGLGAMKINADVEVKDGHSGNSICKGEAGKSFAWGGMLGAMTGIEDVEKDFAKEVSRGFGEMLGIAPVSASK